MGMKYADEPFNTRMLFLPKASINMGTFSDPHTQIRAFSYWSRPLLGRRVSRSHYECALMISRLFGKVLKVIRGETGQCMENYFK